MKKSLSIILFSIIVLAGCTCNNSTTPEVEVAPADSVVVEEVDSLDMGTTVTNIPPLWKVEMQNDNTEKLKEPETHSADLAPQQMVEALNTTYPDIQLDFQRISNDTAYIDIPRSEYLSRQIGSTGAYNYLATAVFNLTELKGVKYVTFKFEEGDHAAPGTYTRDEFKRLR